MQAFTVHNGIVAPLDRANVDTDAIIPKQYLKSIHRSGFGQNLFDHWRYLDQGEPGQQTERRLNPDFVLNHPRHQQASILLARENFGCGSSREHAVWALTQAGFRAVLAPSFSDIFFNNCFKNGFLPIVLSVDVIDNLFQEVMATPGYALTIDLHAREVRATDGRCWAFEVDDTRHRNLVNGHDEIDLTLEKAEQIRAYEQQRRAEAPWLFGGAP